jgi:hypothetical protein
MVDVFFDQASSQGRQAGTIDRILSGKNTGIVGKKPP